MIIHEKTGQKKTKDPGILNQTNVIHRAHISAILTVWKPESPLWWACCLNSQRLVCISSIIINNIYSLEPNKNFGSVFKHLCVNVLIKSFFPFHLKTTCVFCLWGTVALFCSHKELFQEYQFLERFSFPTLFPLENLTSLQLPPSAPS